MNSTNEYLALIDFGIQTSFIFVALSEIKIENSLN